MKPIRTFLLMMACASPLLAAAQWQWIDPAGRRVFSDQPPPPEIPDRNVLKQPAPRSPALVFTPAPGPTVSAPARPAPPPAAAAGTASAPGVDKELEARRRQAEAAETAKRKAEEERIARARVDNCARARSGKATIDSGQRLARTNEKGEREFLDDAARAAESRRLDEIIASDCKAP